MHNGEMNFCDFHQKTVGFSSFLVGMNKENNRSYFFTIIYVREINFLAIFWRLTKKLVGKRFVE